MYGSYSVMRQVKIIFIFCYFTSRVIRVVDIFENVLQEPKENIENGR